MLPQRANPHARALTGGAQPVVEPDFDLKPGALKLHGVNSVALRHASTKATVRSPGARFLRLGQLNSFLVARLDRSCWPAVAAVGQ